MSEVAEKTMLEYLKQVVALESSVYRQEKAVETAKKNLVYEEPIKKTITKPTNPKEAPWINEEIQTSNTEVQQAQKKLEDTILAKKGEMFLGVFLMLGGVTTLFLNLIILAIPIFVAGIILVRQSFKLSKEIKDVQVQCQNIQEENRKIVEKANKEYEEKLKQYQTEILAENESYEKRVSIAEKQYHVAENVVTEMSEKLEQSKEVLEKLYAFDYIFPKYRNLVAMCSIYEYFMTRRCTELTGADGAYNLYEAELRQNLIIARLDKIILSLDKIADNQYTLYSELKETNAILKDVSSDVKGILQSTKNIEEYSHITALSSYATAKNTEALKYISLING